MPEVRKNLVSSFLLTKFGLKQVYEADKFILSKGSVFVGKGYASGDLFKLNVITPSSGNKMNDSLTCSSILYLLYGIIVLDMLITKD